MKFVAALTISLIAACGGHSPETSEPIPSQTDSATDTPTTAPAQPAPMAPEFSLPDLNGETVELSALRGKTVVLEWFNPGCPFVKYAHGEGPLAAMAGSQEESVAWLAINSSAPGKQGHGLSTNRVAAREWKMEHPILLDEDGTVGRLYGATSTPAMIVINPKGELIYKGALDNAPLGKAEGEPVNYVEEAIKASVAGALPETRETASYGCSVKYDKN